MQRNTVMKKIISFVMIFCMVFQLSPVGVWAAEAQNDRVIAEQVAMYMMDFGLVDAEGNMIYDNSFTLEDGTRLANLDELLDWLIECDDDELSTLITVDATGKTATAEWIIEAIAIETEMELLTDSLNRIAGTPAITSGEDIGGAIPAPVPVVSDAQLAPHNLYLIQQVSGDSTDTVTFKVGLSATNSASGTFVAAPNDVVIESGFFCDFMLEWFNPEQTVHPEGSTNSIFANKYASVTLSKGQQYVEYKLDLAKVREMLNSEIDAQIDNVGLYYNYGLWGGAVPVMFQSRVASGARQQSANTKFYVARQAKLSDAAYLAASVNHANAKGSYYVAKSNSGTAAPFTVTLSNVGTETVDGVEYYKLSLGGEISGVFASSTGGTAKSMKKALTDLYFGIGQDNDMTITIEGGAIVTGKKQSETKFNSHTLYYKDENGEMHDVKHNFFSEPKNDNDKAKLQMVAAMARNQWAYTESDSFMKAYYDKLLKGDIAYVVYSSLNVPTFSDDSGDLELPKTFYVKKDWLKKGNDSVAPTGFLLWGTMTYNDNKAPTVVADSDGAAVSVVGNSFRPGDVMPITVTFTEPIVGDVKLMYKDGSNWVPLTSTSYNYGAVYGTVRPTSDSNSNNSVDISRHRTFYYTVQPGDTGLQVGYVQGNGAKDLAGKAVPTEIEFDAVTVGEGALQALSIEDGVDAVAVEYPIGGDPLKARVKVTTKSGLMYKNLYANYSTGDKKFKLVMDWDRTTPLENCTLYDVTIGEENGSYIFTSDITLDESNTGQKHTVELVCAREYEGWAGTSYDCNLYWGTYDQFVQQPVVYAYSGDYTIDVTAAGWPSELAGTVYAEDYDTPVFSYVDNGGSYTYKNFADNALEWKSSDESVVTLVPMQDGSGYTVVAQSAGTAKIYLQCNNGGKKDTVASNAIEIKVVAGSSPALMIPKNANTVSTRANDALQVAFYSNLDKYTAFDSSDGDITVRLYEGGSLPAADATPIWSSKLARSNTNVTIPEDVLTKISVGGEASYTLVLTANAVNGGSRKDLQTAAYIVVNSQPAVVTLSGLDNPMFAHTDNINIGWQIENFDLVNNAENCQFEFTVEKDGVQVYKNTDKQMSGSYTLDAAQPSGLKDTYLVMARAKNGTDPTWSIASSTVTVYNGNALKMWVDGKEQSRLTLQNNVSGNATTTDPAITTYDGDHYDGLTTAEAIAALRTELSLMESVSVNYGDHNWSLLYDTIKWTSENVSTGQTDDDGTADIQKIVSINYRQSMYYEPLENFSYLYYVPETIMMLCGLADGTAKVTAQHSSVDSLKAELTVDVNRLKNKLYLFQFAPAVTTNLYYVDGTGAEHNVTSNSDGSLALYEPNGIASDLRLGSVSGGVEYRSTVDVRSLSSGEGNGVKSELYPLNAIELNKGAVAEFTLLKPDGTPLANTPITVRGGVYRNPEDAERRDDAYCENARFTDTLGASASWEGTEDMTFTTDASGKVTVRMDSKQFVSALDSEDVQIGDNFRFVFEVRFAGDKYNPEIIVIDTGMTYRDTIRSGNNILTLTAADGKKPLVVTQSVDYYTGRDIDVRRHTGLIGPSSDYPALELSTQLMLWGIDGVTTDDTGYRFDVRAQETAVKLPGQEYRTAKDVSYPFSTIPLLENVTEIDEDSFADFKAAKRIPMELVLYKGDGSLCRTLTLPFGLVDLSAIDKVAEDQSLINLLGNLAIYGNASGEVSDDGSESNKGTKLKGVASDIVEVIDSLKNVGSKLGLVRTVLMPTADPSIFSAYVWMGYDTTEMADLRYDKHGIYMEPTHILQSEDQACGTFFGKYTISDFRAMSDGTYQRSEEDTSSLVKLMFGEGNVMQGWMSAEICYDFDKGKWGIVATGGGFTYGKQIEVGGRAKQKFKPFPWNYKITARGGIVVSLETAVRYAEQLGNEWDDETARAVNDWLTTVRINAYIEAYAGLGIDKGLVATVGAFGNVEMNNENRILRRSYLANPDDRKLSGSFVQLDGELGIRTTFGIGPLTVEWIWVSIKLGDQWRFNDWNEIDNYWKEAGSGYSTGWLNAASGTAAYGLQADYGGQTAIASGSSGVKLQSRDYLAEGDREWYGGSMLATMSLDATNRLQNLQSNSYPLSKPLVSDDGEILVYLSDNDSTDVEQVEVRYSLLGEGGQMYPVGTAIAGPADFAGYGDSSLDFDGDSEHAGAVWLREAATLGLKAGADVTLAQQLALVNGLEVVAAIWDGDKEQWTTTRLTDNATQEMSPVIAVAADGDAIVAWRAVQNSQQTGDDGDLQMDFGDSRILYKLYDHATGQWSDTAYTLYNGSAGSVKGLSVEMIDDTAAVAFVLDNGVAVSVDDNNSENSENSEDNEDLSGSEIYYAVIDTTAGNIEDATKTVRATTNTYLDEDPQLAAVDEQFVLGWRTMQTESGVEQNDVALRVFGKNGAPVSVLPESLSNMVSTESFNGQFTFVKGADALDGLSLLWNDAAAGGKNNDVIRAIRFGKYDGVYAASASIEVAALPENTYLTHIDASAVAGDESVHAVMQANTYSATDTEQVTLTVDTGEGEYTTTVNVPTETSGLYSATGTYADSVAVISTNVDYNSLSANAPIPVTFTVENQGLHKIDGLTLTINGTDNVFDVDLLPGKTEVLSAVVKTGNTIEDMPYSLTAGFVNAGSKITETVSGTLYLDYPDVGISSLQTIKEQDGERSFIALMYNQAAASLTSGNRRVVLGVYSDPECEMPLDSKYFGGSNMLADSTSGDFEIVIDGDSLSVIDNDNFAKELTFDIGQYIADYAAAKKTDLKEIPDQGVMLFVKARVEQLNGTEWQELPEADLINNQKNITFDSLLARSNDEPATMSVEMSETDGRAQAVVQVRNNSLQAHSGGHLLATLVNADGGVVETVNVADVNLTGEGVLNQTVNFSTTGSRVVLSYGDAVADTTTAAVKSITVNGLPLTLDSFDAENKATVSGVARGSYVMTVATKSSAAKVTVNSVEAENGIAEVQAGGTYTIEVTSADGTDTVTYTVSLKKASSGGGAATKPEQTKPVEVSGDNPFIDVKAGDWFYDSVLYVYNNGLMNGTDARTFEPNSPTTRGMIVTMLYRLAGAPEVTAANPYNDVKSGMYYEDAITWAAENGVVTGYDAVTFGPDDSITREQMAAILWRYAKLNGVDVSVGEDTNILSFDDGMKVAEYAMAAMQWACGAGIINGVTESTLEPQGKAIRAQVAVILQRYCENVLGGIAK